jgi:hypothetical protein
MVEIALIKNGGRELKAGTGIPRVTGRKPVPFKI